MKRLLLLGAFAMLGSATIGAQLDAALGAYVRRGTVSYEFRNYVLNGIDVTATLLARCSGPAGFFPMTHRLYATQKQWVGRISGLSEPQKEALRALPERQRLARLAEAGGLTQIAALHGVSAARANQCLTDQAGMDRLNRIGEAASALGVTGTPTFFINGVQAQVNTWPDIEPLLRQAGG